MPLGLGRGAAYARFYGLIFEGAQGGSTTNIYAYGNAHDIEISGCENRGSARQGFFSEASVSRIHIIGCYFHDNGGSGPSQQDHNVYLQGSYNAVLGNLITGAGNGYGVQVYPSGDHALVAGNTITNNGAGGIVIGSDNNGTTHRRARRQQHPHRQPRRVSPRSGAAAPAAATWSATTSCGATTRTR